MEARHARQLYLSIFQPLRAVTRRLPHFILVPVAHALNFAAGLYLSLAKIAPLPMRDYVVNIFGRFDKRTRYLAVYDQLNPDYAKYYTRTEAVDFCRAPASATCRCSTGTAIAGPC